MKCMQINPLPAELLMYLIHQKCINRDTSITLIMGPIIRVSLLNCASPADRAPSVPRKPLIHLVPWLESVLSGFSCPRVLLENNSWVWGGLEAAGLWGTYPLLLSWVSSAESSFVPLLLFLTSVSSACTASQE